MLGGEGECIDETLCSRHAPAPVAPMHLACRGWCNIPTLPARPQVFTQCVWALATLAPNRYGPLFESLARSYAAKVRRCACG